MHVDSRNIRENVLMYQNRCFSQFALFDNDNDNNAVVIFIYVCPRILWCQYTAGKRNVVTVFRITR